MLVASSLVSLSVGAILMGLTSYVPTFVQGVLGTGALVAAFALAVLTIGWPIAASQAGRLYLRVGFRTTALIGSVLVLAGSALLLLLGDGSPVWQVGATCFVIGSGMGLIATPTLIAAQSSVDWSERGVVTSTNISPARSVVPSASRCSARSSTPVSETPPSPTRRPSRARSISCSSASSASRCC